jgi:excisionase family DNA binding protein
MPDASLIPVPKALPAAEQPSQTPAVLLVDSREGARLLGIGARTLWRLTDRGEIPCVRIGRAVRYSVQALREWIARTEQGGPAGGRGPVAGGEA